MRGETSPVYAPPVSVCMFCAQSAMPLSATIVATSVSQGNGGHTTTSTPPDTGSTAALMARASDDASSRVVFIFQLPTTSGLATWPDLCCALAQTSRALVDLVPCPALHLGEVLDE